MPTFRSFAKVNLHLEVVGRREDGYHELRTLFQTIDLADELEVERGGRGVALEVVGADLPAGPGNLAWRAAAAFLARWADAGEGVRLRLTKRIPAGGGLGGGSANAATVLLALCAVWNLRPAYPELWREARELGADVPFFLVGGTALGFGRGDEIVPLPDPAGPARELWLAMPPFAVPSRAVFEALEDARRRQPSALLLAAEIGAAPPRERGWVGDNDLEPAAFRLRPELEAIYTHLAGAGATAVRLSGSGSTLFALFDDPAAARAAGVGLPFGTTWLRSRALDRAAWRRASGFDALEGGI
jgi:4-diphosphocytidyl-2-C-methyl-D-erythritol kinase